MTNISLWILAAVVYGLACGGVYTWMSERRSGTWKLFLRSSAVFFAISLIIIYLIYRIIQA